MKKIKCLVSAFVLGVALLPMGVNASEIKNVPVTQSVDSTYTVTLPKSIDMGKAKTKDYEFTVTGNIDPTQAVSVTATNAFTMERQNDATTTVQGNVVVNKTSFSESDINAGGAGTGRVTANPTKAGTYSGTAVFTLDLVSK